MPKSTSRRQAPAAPSTSAPDQEVAALQDRLARAMADYQNLEKRFARDSGSIVKFANAALLEKLLDLRDHLGHAAAHSSDQSLSMILSLFDKLLAEEGVKEVDTAGAFDPTLMECQELVAGEKDRVVSVSRRGYTLHDRVLRPARVAVGNGQPLNKSN